MCKHPLDVLEARTLRESHESLASPLDGKVMVFFRGHYNKLLRVEEEDVSIGGNSTTLLKTGVGIQGAPQLMLSHTIFI